MLGFGKADLALDPETAAIVAQAADTDTTALLDAVVDGTLTSDAQRRAAQP